MQSTSKEIIQSLLAFALQQTDFVIESTKAVKHYDDFLTSMKAVVLFNSTCMCLQTIGGTVRKIDSQTEGKLLCLYPETPWRKVIGMRNIISHDYLSIDPEVVYMTVKNQMRPLRTALERIGNDLEKGNVSWPTN